jgi:parallel beta-helix repeat protein
MIQNNKISGNVGDAGGGIFVTNSSSPTIQNNEISGNSANTGGGIHSQDNSSFPRIINNTISRNSASTGGGIYCRYTSFPTVLNTILWANSPVEIFVDAISDINITYSDIQGGWPGAGNINADPLFGNPFSGLAYDLKPGSPCINAGTSVGAPSTDIVGRPRPSGSGVDIGAYEQNDDASLPVELSAFSGTITQEGVLLQ